MIIVENIPSATVFVMMLAMGMTLTTHDFIKAMRSPRAALVGLFGQLVLLPGVAVAIALVLALPEDLAIGLLLIAVCPGGTTSNALTLLARGDIALSISLTAISSLVAFTWVPAAFGWGLGWLRLPGSEIELPVLDFVLRILVTTGLPVLLGMAIRRWRPAMADRSQKPLLNVSVTILLLLIVLLPFSLASQQVDLMGLFLRGAPAVLLLLIATGGFAVGASRLLGLPRRVSVTLVIEVGIQNFALAMVLAFSVLQEQRYLGIGLVYLFAMMILASGVVAYGRRDSSA